MKSPLITVISNEIDRYISRSVEVVVDLGEIIQDNSATDIEIKNNSCRIVGNCAVLIFDVVFHTHEEQLK